MHGPCMTCSSNLSCFPAVPHRGGLVAGGLQLAVLAVELADADILGALAIRVFVAVFVGLDQQAYGLFLLVFSSSRRQSSSARSINVLRSLGSAS